MSSPETLTLGLLPERKKNWRSFLVGYSGCAVIILIVLSLPLLWPSHMGLGIKYTVTELIPLPNLERRVPKPQPKPIKPLPVVKFDTPRLIVPKDTPRPKIEQAKIEPPKIQPVNFEVPKLQPVAAQLPKIIHTGSFGSSATPTVVAPIQKVQTGGFGDPNGLPGEGKQGAKLSAAKLGSFDLPEGPGTGNGTGGAKGIKGTIVSTGFGNGVAQPPQGRANGNGVQTAGFQAQQVATNTRRVQNDTAAITSQVEVLYKPKPMYTDEARKLNLEGQVLLEVMFGANGELKINRVIRGLGHGLDEAAIAATNKIKYKPAQRNGAPVDFTGTVTVTFQLAS